MVIGCSLMVVFLITIMLKRTGYICLKNTFPKVLVCSFSIFFSYFNLIIFIIDVTCLQERVSFSKNISHLGQSRFFVIPARLKCVWAFSVFCSFYLFSLPLHLSEPPMFPLNCLFRPLIISPTILPPPPFHIFLSHSK